MNKPHEQPALRRKSRWRSINQKRARKFTLMRAAKERLRIERANAEPVLPDTSHVRLTRRIPAEATITERFADGHSFSTAIHRAPWGGINPSRTAILREIATTLDLLP